MIVRIVSLFLISAALFSCSGPQAVTSDKSENEPINVLMVTATHGFRHGPAIEVAHQMAMEVSQTDEFNIDVTEDVSDFNSETLSNYDVLFFANSTLRLVDPESDAEGSENWVTAEQQNAIQEFVRSGKGVAVAHAGLDAFYKWDWYKQMVGGGLFVSHPWTQNVGITVEEPSHPGVSHFGEQFEINDEIYVLDTNPRWSSRVLASLDMQSVGVEQGPSDPSENDHPISWVRKHDGGSVFVTKLGHFPAVWQNEGYRMHVLQGLRMVAGRVPAEFGGYRVKEVIADNVWPDDIAVDEKGNVWIVELRGKIHYYDAELGETRFITELATTDPTGIEHGIYGVEVDPNFHDGEPYVYIFYAEPNTFINTLSRFEYANGTLDLGTEHVLLRVPTEPQCCHQAGDLEWGPDGTLYISTGDTGYSGTRPTWEISEEQVEAFKEKHNLKDFHWTRLVDSEATSQNLTDPRGKILRINKDGSIPMDNPFYGQPGVRWDIYAYGLRNPYRFKVDHDNGDLYIGVVGPDGGHDYDEYNISETGGENFGWPRQIGTLFYNEWTPDMIPGYVPPVWEYDYEKGGRSATVGPIYRSSGKYAFPGYMQDKVFLYDWSRRWIKYADVSDSEFVNDSERDVRAEPLTYSTAAKRLTNIKQFDQLTNTTPISMELGPDGSLYVAEFDGFWNAGPNARVTRYRWIAEDNPDEMEKTEME
ncbi:MAG: ThuA domain-containing protein [Rhodothermaceae bacterium]|nr:ThuA domain-containing protein [Rhodothermaceae bacterium]